jgi:hypothetical protein
MMVRVLGALVVVASMLAAGAGCSRDPGNTSDAGRSAAVTLEAGGRCLWLEHHSGQKYLNLCVQRAFATEAELTSEWRPLGAEAGASAVAPDRLTHHVTAGEEISRGSITVIVRSLGEGRVVVERL